MATVTFKGDTIRLKGDIPDVGEKAPNFTLVKDDLSEIRLSDFAGKNKILMSVPSLDTGVCQTQTRIFNKNLETKQNAIGMVISMDLPFAMKRFCESEGIKNIINASDYRYQDFIGKYNLKIEEGPLKGLSARSVFVLNKDDQIKYLELVPEIVKEPDYEKALNALNSISA